MKIRNFVVLALAALLYLGLGSPAPGAQASQPEAPFIRLQYASFDPLLEEPQPAPLSPLIEDEGGDLFLLQFSGPIQEEWLTAAQQAGAQLYGYIPDFAFISRMDAAARQRVQRLPFVRWIGSYLPAYRLAESLQFVQQDQDTAPGEPVLLAVQTLPGVDLPALAAQVEGLGGQVLIQAAKPDAGYLRISIAPRQAGQVAALDEVLWVEPYIPPEPLNDIAGGTILRLDELRTSLGLYGAGQVVAVADTGLDTGSLANLHPDLGGRLLAASCLGRPDFPNPGDCDWSDYMAHGTHVAGSVLGSGIVSGSDPALHDYSGSYAGVAPEAQLIFQSLADEFGALTGIPWDEGELVEDAHTAGARIHSNSWGSDVNGVYDIESQQFDQAMWDLENILVLFAAGNAGEDSNHDGVIDLDSLYSPATAKNVLSVGGSENYRPSIPNPWGSAYGAPINNDLRANDPNGMMAFSSRGPTNDGRIKPDVVASGSYIISLRSRQYVFNDDLEGDISGYTTATESGGTGDSWELLNDSPHSGSYYLRQTISGTFNPEAMTFLLTPPMDVRIAGKPFDVNFFHKYVLNPGDELVVMVMADDGSYEYHGVVLSDSGSRTTYAWKKVSLNLTGFDSPPDSVRIGFAIQSDGSSDSAWWVDDIRVDGYDWGALSAVSLTTPGSAVDDAYSFLGGTSMATPLTAGAAALARQWLVTERGITDPSAAAVKALLLNGAADISPGQYGTGATQEVPSMRPNPVSGWGRVDLVESLEPPWPRQVWVQDNTGGVTTEVDSTHFMDVGWAAIPNGHKFPLRITLAWTDYPASLTAAKTLVNDLDLEVIAPDGTHYYGNSGLYSSGQCLRTSLWDACNNVESVYIPLAPNGQYTIRVLGYNVPHGPQPYALAATGTNLAGTAEPPDKLYLPLQVR